MTVHDMRIKSPTLTQTLANSPSWKPGFGAPIVLTRKKNGKFSSSRRTGEHAGRYTLARVRALVQARIPFTALSADGADITAETLCRVMTQFPPDAAYFKHLLEAIVRGGAQAETLAALARE